MYAVYPEAEGESLMVDTGRTCEHPDYPEPQEHIFDNDAGARVEMAQKPLVKQYGLPRSGTNALKAVLQANIDLTVLTAESGSKHSCCSDTGRSPVVVSVKDPYAWVESVWRYECRRRKRAIELSAFILEPYEYNDTWRSQLRFGTPMAAWNTMNRHWLYLEGAPVLAVRARDLCDPTQVERVLRSVGVAFGLGYEWRGGVDPVMPRHRMAATSGAVSAKDDHQPVETDVIFDPAHYLERRYLSSYTAKDLLTVTSAVDWELAGELNYHKEA